MPSLDLAFVRGQFPALAGDTVFLDNAGGSQVLAGVADRIRDYLLTTNVQHGATYAVSQTAAARLHDAQVAMAAYVNAARPDEIVMGPTSTMLLQILARAMAPQFSPGDEVIVSRADHESNIGPWVGLEAAGVRVLTWELNRESGDLELADLDALMTARTRLVAVTHASNIFGAVHPVAAIARFVHERGARLVVDGVAYAPHRVLDVQAWDVDFYVFSAYKVFGPHHAVLYGRYDHLLGLANQYHYFIPDDRIPYKLQPGNPNYELSYGTAGIVDYFVALGERHGAPTDGERRGALARAFDLVADHEAALAARLLAFLATKRRVRVVGPPSPAHQVRVPTISFVVEGRRSRDVVAHTDACGLAIRHGDFHSRRLVEHLGYGGADGVVRVSMVHYNTLDEVDRLILALDQVV